MILLEASTWVGVSLAVFLAFSLKAMTGFGENLIMIPLISFFLPLPQVLPMTLVVVLVADGVLLYKLYDDIVWWYWKRMAGIAILGVFLGSFGLQELNAYLLEKLLGLIIILYAIISLLPGRSLSIKINKASGTYLAGLSGGVLSGIIGIGGPPVITYLNAQHLQKAVFRATCVVTFLVFDILRLGSYSYQGLMTLQTALTGLTLLPAFIAGTALGLRLHPLVPERPFQIGVRILLMLIGLSLLFQ